MTPHDRPPPNSPDAEQLVLGSMMLSPLAIAQVRANLEPGDFFTPANQTVCQAIFDAADENGPTNIAGIQNRMVRAGTLASIGRERTPGGGADYLGEILEATPGAGNAGYYAGIVRDCAGLRSLTRVCDKLRNRAFDASEDPTVIIADATEAMQGIETRQRRGRGTSATAAEAAQEALDLSEAVGHGEVSPGLDTGFPEIDRPAPWRPGDLITLASRTGEGKTSLALNGAGNVAHAGGAVLFVSAEMRAPELGRRMLASRSGVDSNRIARGLLTADEAAAVKTARADIDKWKLTLLCRSATAGEIGSKVRGLTTLWRRPPDLIVVDYLQLMRFSDAKASKAAQIGGIAWGLKALAMDTGAVVLMLSQLNRETVKGNCPPVLWGLKESGDIENHSNVVLFLHEPPDEADTDGAKIIWARIAKARDGRTTPWPRHGEHVPGSIRLRFRPTLTRFESKAKQPTR